MLSIGTRPIFVHGAQKTESH